MPYRRARGHHPSRALRREVPSTVAVLAAREDFTAMRGYRTFAFDDYAAYLRDVQELLRTLSAQRVHTRVTHFDPGRFAAYCAEQHLDPDTSRSRTLYTAEVAGSGVTVPYSGQRWAELLPVLRDHRARQTTWDEASRLLAAADRGGGETRGGSAAALESASHAVDLVLTALGPGAHHLVCSVSGAGAPLLAVLPVSTTADGQAVEESALLLMCAVLAVALATGSPGGLVARTTACGGAGAGREAVRGWSVRRGWLQPLTEAEVFSAYCTHAETGEPVPPEPGVDYRAGLPLPRPGPRRPGTG